MIRAVAPIATVARPGSGSRRRARQCGSPEAFRAAIEQLRGLT